LIRLCCATGNLGKLREFQSHSPISIETLPNFQQIPPCVEDGATFEENAVIKARHYGRYASCLLFADDSGLEVDALGGAPGVHSARFSGPRSTDQANNRLLLEKLRGVANRTARFVCVIALVEGGPLSGNTRLTVLPFVTQQGPCAGGAQPPCQGLRGVFRGAVEGVILDEPRGSGGFGYDPLFYCPALGLTFGEASADRKFSLSHRGQALRAMLAAL
jgi:XTP/dITP diphosphohydrolase